MTSNDCVGWKTPRDEKTSVLSFKHCCDNMQQPAVTFPNWAEEINLQALTLSWFSFEAVSFSLLDN